jgi:hypothetical protein
MGISQEIIDGLWNLISIFFHPNQGVTIPYTTTGNGTKSGQVGVQVKIAENTNRICPALTIFNNSSSTINIGSNGYALFPLLGGSSFTWRFKNPAQTKLVFDDLGNANLSIIVIG